uniref:Uncharacterized protein n=1 Tax=Fagus sylvatica TaxID=28930 RepID=A0A2N9J301_FAGSY
MQVGIDNFMSEALRNFFMLVFLIVKCTQMSVAAELVNNYWL